MGFNSVFKGLTHIGTPHTSKQTNLSPSITAGFQLIVKPSTTDLSFRETTFTGTSHGSRGA